MRLPKLAAPGDGAEAGVIPDPGCAKTTDRLRSRTAGWRRSALVAVAAMVVLAGCGGSPRPSAGPGPVFPGTPAGAQARWFFQALGRPPIPDAAIRAHFAPAFLAQNSPALINARLAGAGQLRLVSVTSTRPNAVEFVMSVRGAQRFRIGLPVDAHGRITNIVPQELAPTASPASVLPALAPGWVAAAGHLRGRRGHDPRDLHPSRQCHRWHGPGGGAARGQRVGDRPQRQRPGSAGPQHAGGGGQLAVGRRGRQPAL